jgi:hypothetical protein
MSFAACRIEAWDAMSSGKVSTTVSLAPLEVAFLTGSAPVTAGLVAGECLADIPGDGIELRLRFWMRGSAEPERTWRWLMRLPRLKIAG